MKRNEPYSALNLHVGNILYLARLSTGMSQRKSAEKIGIHCGILSNYETGKTIPRVEIFQNILSVYGYSVTFEKIKK